MLCSMGVVRRFAHATRLGLAVVVFGFAGACRDKTPPIDAGPATVTSADISPAKAPPALRLAHPVVPILPDLPPLDAHEAPSIAPAAPADTWACRSVWTGEMQTPLSCSKSSLVDGVTDSGAEALVGDDILGNPIAILPGVVDHRADGTEGAVRNQATTPACTAFAIAGAMDHAIARWTGKPGKVSVMHIWSRYHEPEERTSIRSNIGLELGSEDDWSFTNPEANAMLPCPAQGPMPKAGCNNLPNPLHLKKVETNPQATFSEVELLRDASVSLLKSKIAAGQDVIVTMTVPSAFVAKGKPGARYVPHYTSASEDSGHAMLLAGYVTFPHGTYFLIHNSWGTTWGDGGYAWIHEATVTKWTREAVVIDADPKFRDAASRPRRNRGETTCANDFVPDSIRGSCAPLCPDGSPRHDGVCAIAGQCPLSYVNLTGTCVLAAPTAVGSDTLSGISWKCGPGGCTYLLPRTADPSCTGNVCKASCPAPDYRIAKQGSQLTCVD